MQLPSEYRAQIIEILKARGIQPTEENILKVANAKKPQPKKPSTGEQLLTGIGGAAATGLGMWGGPAIGKGIAGKLGMLGAGKAAGATAAGTAGATAAGTAGATAAGTAGATAAGTAGTVGTTGAGITIPGSLGAAPTATPLLPIIAATAAAIASGYNTKKAWESGEGKSPASALKDELSKPRAWLTPPAILGALGGSLFGSSKDTHQKARDYARDRMVGLGIYEHKPATDDVFSMGGDSGYRLPDGRRAFEIVKGMAEGAPEREFTQREGEVIGALNPLSYIVGQGRSRGDVDIAGNTTGLLYNELANRGEEGVTDAEILDLYSRAGATQGSAFEAINELARLDRISEDEQKAAHNALNQLYGSEYYSTEDDADREAARRLLGL